jgi:hypothetical protein
MDNFDPPIQSLDAFDVVGERKDGGVDLVITCRGPLDESADTLGRIDQKIRGYITTATSSSFSKAYPAALHGPTTIYLSCDHAISAGALGLVNELGRFARQQNIELKIVKSDHW